jgi:hypothetical protein
MDAGMGMQGDQSEDGEMFMPAPGDEGFGISHAGGEYEVFEGLADDIAGWTGM